MPVVRIDIQAGKSTAYKRDILHAVRSAITESLGVSDDPVLQRIVETPAENIDAPDSRTDHLTIVEVSMLPGQSTALKQAMYGAIVAHLGEKPGIHHHDIMVVVSDPSAECFTVGGVMQCKLSGGASTLVHEPAIPASESDEDAQPAAAVDSEPKSKPGAKPKSDSQATAGALTAPSEG